MSEIEPIRPQAVVQELAHWQGQQEIAQAQVDYYQSKIDACIEVLRVTNVIWIADERWQQ